MNKHDNKREAAKVLFMEGISQESISKILEIAPRTITRWKSEDNWINVRNSKQLLETTTQESSRELLNYELQLHLYYIRNQMALPIEERKPIDNPTSLSNIRTFKQLTKQEIIYEQYIKVTKQILEFICNEDLTLAKQVEPVLNNFLNAVSKNLI